MQKLKQLDKLADNGSQLNLQGKYRYFCAKHTLNVHQICCS